MKAVVFDLDGTLIDTTGLILNTYVNTIKLLGGIETTVDDILSNYNIGPTSTLLEHFLGRPITSQDLDAYYVAYEAAILGLKPFPNVIGMLEHLQRMGYRLGLFTSATRRAVSLVLLKTGLDKYFEATVAGDEVTYLKPAPEGLELVCRRLEVSTKETVYVGDAEVDLECARNAGAFAIQAAWGSAAIVLAGDHLVAHRPDDVITLINGTSNAALE